MYFDIKNTSHTCQVSVNNIDFYISHIRFQLLRNFHDLLENLLKVVTYRAVDNEVHRGIKDKGKVVEAAQAEDPGRREEVVPTS